MSGLLMDERFIAVFPSLVRALGNVESAVILQHIHWAADASGQCRITQQQISDETGISLRTVERRVKALREGGWLSAERSAAYDAALIYRVETAKLADSRPQSQSATPGGAKVADSETAKVADSSLQKEEELPSGVLGTEAEAPNPTPLTNTRGAERRSERLMDPRWTPGPSTMALARERYPNVAHAAIAERLVYWAVANNRRSGSWEATFLSWCSTDQQRYDEEARSGTDDLGVPRSQKRTSTVAEGPQPGDPDYFDPIAYLEEQSSDPQ